MPTVAQPYQSLVVSVWLTEFYRPVDLVRIDERTVNIIIIAGEETVFSINADGTRDKDRE